MDRVTWPECLMVCANTPTFVAEYDRLRGSNLSGIGSPLDLMIDQSSGRLEAEFGEFVEFVRDAVWDRLPPEIKAVI